MTCNEFRNLLNDYFDDLLPEIMQKQIELHLKECSSCRSHQKKFENYFKAVEELPLTINPETNLSRRLIIDGEDEASSKPKPELKGTVIKRLKTQTRVSGANKESDDKILIKTPKPKKKKVQLKSKIKSAAKAYDAKTKNILYNSSYVILISLLVYMVYILLKDSSAPWTIEIKNGTYKLNGQYDNSYKIDAGESISTDEVSEVRLIIPEIAVYELGKNSSLTVKKAYNDENKVVLHNGSLAVSAWSPKAFVNVEFRNINLTQYQSSFSLNIDSESNNIILTVNTGDVTLESIRENLRVPKKHTCVIAPNNKFGIPVREKANKDFKRAVELYEQGNSELAIVQTITSLASDEDALTLLEVLRLERIFFEEIYHRLVGFFPPPPTVSKEGLKQRNSSDYTNWWEEIEWQI
ncbi:MAG TPA: zf-HC2 domain-containing protein [Ignavibacteriaceae bacterium]|nr:zf-HC2 domain-containing protein [Ignavibacteriaceae bacterium]